MNRSLPLAAVLLGVAGLIPFVGCGLAAVAVGDATQASRGLSALIAYAAVILAFLGGVHWGFALAPDLPARGVGVRLGLATLPSLIGWLAIVLPLVLPPETALAVLMAGFIGLVVVEAAWRKRGLVPAGYLALRWGLSVAVVLVLATVFTLRLAGARIVI